MIAATLVAALGAGGTTFLPIPAGSDRPPALSGRAVVTDGDTIRVGAERIRLHGIDAPEAGQTCTDEDGQAWDCGDAATLEMRRLIATRPVSCERKDVDRYGRIVATCFVDDVDVAGRLVAEGLALAYRRYSSAYVPAELRARLRGRGMWAGDFEEPWVWRRR